MFVPNAIWQYFVCKSVVTNPMFVPNATSAILRMQINGYKPHVRSQCDFLQYFVCKSVVTNHMFLPNAIAPIVRM